MLAISHNTISQIQMNIFTCFTSPPFVIFYIASLTTCKVFCFVLFLSYKQVLVHKIVMIHVPYSIIIEHRSLGQEVEGSSPALLPMDPWYLMQPHWIFLKSLN